MTNGQDQTCAENVGRWHADICSALKRADITMVGYVPDAGHAPVIDFCRSDPQIEDVVLTTEEEGVGLAAGAWLGGKRCVLLMQSSGVGNCINTFSLQKIGRFPMVILVTMRGEYAEFNPWQIPMSSITEKSLDLCGFLVYRAREPEEVGDTVSAAIEIAFNGDVGAAVLLSQKLIGRKEWVR